MFHIRALMDKSVYTVKPKNSRGYHIHVR